MGDSLGIPGAVGFYLLSLWPPSRLLWSPPPIHPLPACFPVSPGSTAAGAKHTPTTAPSAPPGPARRPCLVGPPRLAHPPVPAHPRALQRGRSPLSEPGQNPLQPREAKAQLYTFPYTPPKPACALRAGEGGVGVVRCGRNLRLAPRGWRVGAVWVDTRTQQRAGGAARPQTPHVPQAWAPWVPDLYPPSSPHPQGPWHFRRPS